jgi:hypothetical protein
VRKTEYDARRSSTPQTLHLHNLFKLKVIMATDRLTILVTLLYFNQEICRKEQNATI